jgi:hypothetical protein
MGKFRAFAFDLKFMSRLRGSLLYAGVIAGLGFGGIMRRDIMRRISWAMAAMLVHAPSVAAQCLKDDSGDGHPLFGSTHQRPDIQYGANGMNLSSARPTDVAFGDLDGDGDLDAAVVGAGQGADEIENKTYLTILLNDWDGVFGPPVFYKAGREVCAVALGDFDGDGDLDAAVANSLDNSVSVFLNAGDSTLATESVHGVGAQPRSVRTADLDEDGDADLVVLNAVSSSVSMLRALGEGGFAPAVTKVVGGVTQKAELNPTFPFPGPFLEVGELDGDGGIL